MWINPVRLPILLVISWTGKIVFSLTAFTSENVVSRDGFGSPIRRQSAHLHVQAESGAYLWDSSRVPRGRPFSYYLKPPYVSPKFIGPRNCVPMAFTAKSPPAQGQEISRQLRTSSVWYLAGHHGPINMSLSFSHPLLLV